jgi:hypothetical protein
MTTVPECLQFCLLLEATRVTSRACRIDSVLSQAMPKFTIYRLHQLSPGRYCWRCCLVPRWLDWRDVSSWRCLTVLLVCALKHPNSFECKIPQMPHMLIVVGRIGSDICCYRHNGSLFGSGQQFDLIEFCLQVSRDVARFSPERDVRPRPMLDARRIV